MKNKFYFNKSIENIYIKPSSNSEVSSQILYGEKFIIQKKIKNWVKIKTLYDNYYGFIKIDKFRNKLNSTHKIFKIRSYIYRKIKNIEKKLESDEFSSKLDNLETFLLN